MHIHLMHWPRAPSAPIQDRVEILFPLAPSASSRSYETWLLNTMSNQGKKMMYKKMPKSDDQTILEMPERRSVRGGSVAIETVFDVNKKSKRLKEMLDQFQEKCIYKNNSIYDIWHIGATIMGGVFLQAQTCFTIYLAHRFFADPMVWVDATFALFILFLIKQELFCSSYLREAKYMFFKSLTMAGVLVDFDNSSLGE